MLGADRQSQVLWVVRSSGCHVGARSQQLHCPALPPPIRPPWVRLGEPDVNPQLNQRIGWVSHFILMSPHSEETLGTTVRVCKNESVSYSRQWLPAVSTES